MSDFYSRLLDEKEELNQKIEKLQAFIGSEKYQEIGGAQMSLLHVQEKIMQAYSQVLTERIALVSPPNESELNSSN